MKNKVYLAIFIIIFSNVSSNLKTNQIYNKIGLAAGLASLYAYNKVGNLKKFYFGPYNRIPACCNHGALFDELAFCQTHLYAIKDDYFARFYIRKYCGYLGALLISQCLYPLIEKDIKKLFSCKV
jgi:hypothetical protein